MVSMGGYHFTIEKSQFVKLERALSVALTASRWMGAESRIFWLRDSIFAATPYACIGLMKPDLELRPERITKDTPDSFAISRAAAKRLIDELRSSDSRFLERIRLLWTPDAVSFKFDYSRESNIEKPVLESRYKGSWLPRLTPREHYERIIDSSSCYGTELSIKSICRKLKKTKSSGYMVFEDIASVVPHIAISRPFLKTFLRIAKSESDRFQMFYRIGQHFIACRSCTGPNTLGNVLAVLSIIG
jgi:hypothetical protein